MNLISVMMAAAIGLIVLTSIMQGMLNQTKMAVHIEYLGDTQTARNNLELLADCKKSSLNTCEVKDKFNNVIVSNNVWRVGRADVKAVCDPQGFNVFAKQHNSTQPWRAIVPLKVCGNGEKVCNLTENSDGGSCAGGSGS